MYSKETNRVRCSFSCLEKPVVSAHPLDVKRFSAETETPFMSGPRPHNSQIAPTAWERFKPYLLIEGVEMNLKRILAIEKRVVGSRLFATIDMLLEAHELSLPPYDHRPSFELSKNTRLVDLLHYAYPEMAIVMPNLPGFFLHKARLNYHVESTWDDYQQLSAMAVGKDLDEEERLANRAHLLELIWYIVNLR